jgi:hypothetical protein
VDFKADVELSRAQEPRRAPIRLPNPVTLPDERSSSSDGTKADDADDLSEAESGACIQRSVRRVVRQKHGEADRQLLETMNCIVVETVGAMSSNEQSSEIV